MSINFVWICTLSYHFMPCINQTNEHNKFISVYLLINISLLIDIVDEEDDSVWAILIQTHKNVIIPTPSPYVTLNFFSWC